MAIHSMRLAAPRLAPVTQSSSLSSTTTTAALLFLNSASFSRHRLRSSITTATPSGLRVRAANHVDLQKHIINNTRSMFLKQNNNGSDSLDPNRHSAIKSTLLFQSGLLLASVAEPAVAVTGVNNEQDLVSVLIQVGVVAFFYFLVAPPIIMNWLRTRWYRRNLLETYLQFMCVFIFFPGVLIWAPFLNFRKFPRDPSLKYPWSKPENPSQVKGGFLKYPWASIEDYE